MSYRYDPDPCASSVRSHPPIPTVICQMKCICRPELFMALTFLDTYLLVPLFVLHQSIFTQSPHSAKTFALLPNARSWSSTNASISSGACSVTFLRRNQLLFLSRSESDLSETNTRKRFYHQPSSHQDENVGIPLHKTPNQDLRYHCCATDSSSQKSTLDAGPSGPTDPRRPTQRRQL